ncbi:MAG: iron hydrogenase [Clostridia bacterium]|nr:iron hydrogenase [Clostridia bacterium]
MSDTTKRMFAHRPTGPQIDTALVQLHPLPVRILHWTQFFIIMILIICGMYLHYPRFLEHSFSTIKNIKGVFNFLLIANTLVYVYYSLRTEHYREIILGRRDLRFIPDFLRYIFFLKKNHGYYGKYNPGHKAVFSTWFLLILLQIFTGLLLFFPDTFGAIIKLWGGLNKIRQVHYLITWLFIASIPIHVYLALTEDPAKLQSIFTGYARK